MSNCPTSPTKAHWWVEHIGVSIHARRGIFICKYCHDTQRMPISTVAAIEATYKLRKGKSLDEVMDELDAGKHEDDPDSWLYR